MALRHLAHFLLQVVPPRRNRRRLRSAGVLSEFLEPRILLSATNELLADLNTSVESVDLVKPRSFTSLGDQVFFVADHPVLGTELWVTGHPDDSTRLVREVSPGPAVGRISDLTAVGEWLYFQSQTDQFGSGFWRTDGTHEGTSRVEFAPEDNVLRVSSSLFSHEDRLYFTAVCSTAAGIRDFIYRIDPGVDSRPDRASQLALDHYASDSPERFAVAGDYLLVKAYNSSYQNIIVSVGPDGSTEVLPVSGGELVPLGNSLLILGSRSSSSSSGLVSDLWITDGTVAGTRQLPELSELVHWPVESESVASDGTHVWFVTSQFSEAKLWRTDGTVSGTSSFEMPEAGGRLALEGEAADGKYYVLMRQTPSDLNQLWVSDGTGSGTFVLSDEVAWPSSSGRILQALSDGVAVAASRPGFEGVWFTNGNDADSRILLSIPETAPFSQTFVSVTGDEVFASFVPGNGRLYRIVRTTGAHTSSRVVIIPAGTAPSSPTFFYSDSWSGSTLFAADSKDGPGIWISNGSREQTRPVSLPGSSLTAAEIVGAPQAISSDDGTLYLCLNSDTALELWTLNPMTAVATLVTRLVAASVDPIVTCTLRPWGSKILFSIRFPGREELWVSSGTQSTIARLQTFHIAVASERLLNFVALNEESYLYLTESDVGLPRLWVSNGDQSQSRPLRSFVFPDDSLRTVWMHRVGDRVVFPANDGMHGDELWVSDGTTTGTRLLKDIVTGIGSSLSRTVLATPQRVFFVAANEPEGENGDFSGESWWSTDGTTEGTVRLIDSNSDDRDSTLETAAAAGRRLYLVRPSGPSSEVVLTVGEGATSTLAEFPSNESSDLVRRDVFFTAFGRLFFVAGKQLWTSNGAASGTVIVHSCFDLIPIEDQNPEFNEPEVWGQAAGSLLYSGWTQPVSFEPIRVSPQRITDRVSEVSLVRSGDKHILKWDPVFGATGYLLEVQSLQQTTGIPQVLTSSGTSWIVPDEMAGIPLTIRIRAVQGFTGIGDLSSPFEILTGERPVILPVRSESEALTAPVIQWLLPVDAEESEIWINDLERKERAVFLTGLRETTLQPEGLRPSRYAVWVRGSSPAGQTPWSAAVVFDVLGVPPELVVDAFGPQASTRRIMWPASPDAFGYEVHLTSLDIPSPLDRRVILGPGSNDWTTPPLPDGLYQVSMRTLAPGRPASVYGQPVTFLIRQPPRISFIGDRASWTAVRRAIGYEVRVLNMVTGATVLTSQQTVLSWTIPTNLAPGRFRLDVRSLYSDQTASNWSSARFEQFAPAVTPIVGSASTVDATPLISWRPVEGVRYYEVVAQQSGSSSPVYRAVVSDGASNRVTPALPHGSYQIWVRAHLTSGGRSVWGLGASLVIGAAPVVRLEENRLVWNPIPGATRYEIQVNRQEAMGSPETVYFRDPFIVQTSLDLPTLISGRYRIWLRAIRDEAGDTYRSRWSVPISIG
jgi:ELWxxDGT repeat protein